MAIINIMVDSNIKKSHDSGWEIADVARPELFIEMNNNSCT
jgi:hypothetical protein